MEYNKALLEKYPWLTPYNVWTGKLDENYNYESTWADDIPDGWRLAFGDQMLEELSQLLKKYNIEKDYSIVQIKEKFGGLRWYDNGFSEKGSKEYFNWLHKYEKLSSYYCIKCGKKGKMREGYYIIPLCDKCFKEEL